MAKQAVVDLRYHGWGAAMNGATAESKSGEPTDWDIRVFANQIAEGGRESDIGMTIKVGENSVELDRNATAELCGRMLTALWFSLGIPNEGVPREFQGSLGAATAWGQMEAANILPIIVNKLIGETVIEGKLFAVRPNYVPNVEASKVVGLDGKAKQTWDGSFRPILMLNELSAQVEYQPSSAPGNMLAQMAAAMGVPAQP